MELEAHLLLLHLIAANTIYHLVSSLRGNILLYSNQAWLCLAHRAASEMISSPLCKPGQLCCHACPSLGQEGPPEQRKGRNEDSFPLNFA